DGIRDKLVTGVQTCALPISDGSDLGAERFRDLDGEASDAAGRAGDCNSLAGAKLRVVAKALQCHRAGDCDRRRLLEAQPLRLRRSEERRVGKECRSRGWPGE